METNFPSFEKNLRLCFRDERMKKGATQADLARRNENIKPATIAKFETGQIPNVTLRSVFELARASSIPLWELIRRAEDEPLEKEEADWDKLAATVDHLPEAKREWLARLLQEALRGTV